MSDVDTSKIIEKDVIPLLGACCARHVPAIVAQPESQAVVKAAFSLLGPDSLRFEVRGQAGAAFTNLAPAVVSYAIDGCVHVFVGSVLGFVPSTGSGYLTMTLPPFVLRPDMRRSFRIPVIEPGRMRVRLEDQGYSVYEPQIVDLGGGGMLIEFPSGADPNFQVKSGLSVEVQLDERVAAYLAEVRHARPGKYGLMFVEASDPLDSVRQGESLKAILSAIEGTWLGRGE